MGVIGEMFPGRKLQSEAGEDGDGQTYRPRVELDLDAGVVRVSPATRAAVAPDDPGESAPAQ